MLPSHFHFLCVCDLFKRKESVPELLIKTVRKSVTLINFKSTSCPARKQAGDEQEGRGKEGEDT